MMMEQPHRHYFSFDSRTAPPRARETKSLAEKPRPSDPRQTPRLPLALPTPIHPDEVLRLDPPEPTAISGYRLSEKIAVPAQRDRIIKGTRNVNGDVALQLARFFGSKRSTALKWRRRNPGARLSGEQGLIEDRKLGSPNEAVLDDSAGGCGTSRNLPMGRPGLEPGTPAFSVRCSTN